MIESLGSFRLNEGRKVYFASDFHFGIPNEAESRQRETKICQWLSEIQKDAQQIYLLGDIYDSWMEYKKVVPKGTIRFLGKLAELTDAGIEIFMFTGNHDLWMHGYFEQELNIKVFKSLRTVEINQRRFLIGHGDGVCKKKEGNYLLLKKLLHHPWSQFIYRQLHPDVGLRLADYFSRLGPKHKYDNLQMKADEEEYQLIFANETLKQTHYDFILFGHRHIPLSKKLASNALFVNLGDWISHYSYAEFDGNDVSLKKY
jgi:UDP-2,3-diacylglucosamine hydrolase